MPKKRFFLETSFVWDCLALLKSLCEAAQSLFIFGAAGLLALGFFINYKLSVPVTIFPWLWAAGGLLIYNLDRLIPDPADAINNPSRVRFRGAGKCIVALSLAMLLVVPLLYHQWLLLGLLIAGAAFCSLYSVAPSWVGSRIKDVPFLKWTIPPFIVMTALTSPAWMNWEDFPRLWNHWPMLGCLLSGLLINILLFDQRDEEGDSAVGKKTLATNASPTRFRFYLSSLLILQILFLTFDPQPGLIAFTSYVALLVCFAKKKRSPWFYHWAVDGMLFIPWLWQHLFRL